MNNSLLAACRGNGEGNHGETKAILYGDKTIGLAVSRQREIQVSLKYLNNCHVEEGSH